MNKTYNRWVRRSTPDGDAIYDRDSRKVYRNRLPPMISETQDLWSLSTFQTSPCICPVRPMAAICSLRMPAFNRMAWILLETACHHS